MAYSLEYLMDIDSEPGLRHKPMRILVHSSETHADLGAINIGKAFSRMFDFNAWVKKAPRVLVGSATGYFMGGGWEGATAGGLTAAAFRRKAGTSLFQDIYRGGLYGAAGGAVVGVGKSLFNYRGPRGYAGQAVDYLKNLYRPAPTGTMTGKQLQLQRARIAGPTVTTSVNPMITQKIQEMTKVSSGEPVGWWQKTQDVLFGKTTTVDGKTVQTGGILGPVLMIGSKVMDVQMQEQAMQMQSEMMEQAKQMEAGSPPPGGQPPGFDPDQEFFYGGPPSGVPGDVSYGGGGGGRSIGGPMQVIQDAVEAVTRPFIGKPVLTAVVLLGASGGAYYLYRYMRRR